MSRVGIRNGAKQLGYAKNSEICYNKHMPNYDYSCRKCNKEFEKNTPMDERDNVMCVCGGEAYRRITFYGSVWSPTKSGGSI